MSSFSKTHRTLSENNLQWNNLFFKVLFVYKLRINQKKAVKTGTHPFRKKKKSKQAVEEFEWLKNIFLKEKANYMLGAFFRFFVGPSLSQKKTQCAIFAPRREKTKQILETKKIITNGVVSFCKL